MYDDDADSRYSMASVYTFDSTATDDAEAEAKGPVGIETREKLAMRVRGMGMGGYR